MEYGSLVGMSSYPKDSPVYGALSSVDVAELRKALETGNTAVAIGGPNTGVSALRPQSLESTLKVVTVTQKHLKLWPKLAKDPARSTLEEFSRLDALGEVGDGFIPEVATPVSTAETMARQAVAIKFMGVKKEVSLASTLVHNIVGNLEAHEAQIATTELLAQLERNLVYGNSTINSLSFDGFIKLISDAATGDASDIVLDWEGKAPDEAMMERACQIVGDHYGVLDYALTSVRGKSNLRASIFPAQRANMPDAIGGAIGFEFNEYRGGSRVAIDDSVFIRDKKPRAIAMTVTNTPANPASFTATQGNDSASKLEANKTYYYWIGMGKQGLESAAVAASAATTALNQKITLSMADSNFGSGANAAEYINIYRSTNVNAIGNATLIAQVARAAGGAPTTYVDLNQNRDNCDLMLGFTWDPEGVVKFKQLAPLMKLSLAVTGTSSPFMVLLFGSPILFAPTKCIYIKNMGRPQI